MASRRSTLLLTVLGVGALGGVVWLLVAGALLYSDASDTSERAAAPQALSAAASLAATIVLLAVTAWYAVLTRGILRHSGPVVDATLRIGWLSPIGARAGVLTAPLATIASGPVDDRYTVPAWAITLANGGNAPTKVASVAVESASGFTFRAIDVVAGPTPLLVLEAHSGETCASNSSA